MFALYFKGLQFKTITLKASDGEHKSKKLLALNPRGTVPVLQDEQVIVRDSVAALAWLDHAYPDTPLFGRDPDQAAHIWQSTMELADYLRTVIDRLRKNETSTPEGNRLMNIAAKNANYTKTIDVNATPDRVFQALTSEMDRWWTTETEGELSSESDTVRVDFPPNNGHWTFEATALSTGKIVELKCIDAHHVVAGQPAEIEKEWLGTTLRWKISAHDVGARVEFEHEGLTPALRCFDICNEGWGFFFATSFAAYLDSGNGMPHTPA